MERLDTLALNEQGFVFDPATGHSYTLNPTGMLVMKGLREGLDPAALAQRLAAATGIDAALAGRDVADFQRHLAKLGLV